MTFTGTANSINAALNGLVYRGNQDYFGPDTLTITTYDQGFNGTGGAQQDVDTVAITVNPVNDAPTLAAIADPPAILEDAVQQTINLSGISEGPGNEASQTLTITATSSNPSIIPNPAVTFVEGNTTGSLSYTPVANAYGSVIITVTVVDSGGTANGALIACNARSMSRALQ